MVAGKGRLFILLVRFRMTLLANFAFFGGLDTALVFALFTSLYGSFTAGLFVISSTDSAAQQSKRTNGDG